MEDESIVRRIPPHNTDAEQAVIGCMILDQEAITVVEGILTSEDFYQRQNGVLFDAILELNNEGRPVDAMTLSAKLKEKELPQELASMEAISQMVSRVTTSINAKAYAQIVYEKAMLRRLIRVTEDITQTCYLDKEPMENVMADTEKKVFDLVQKRDSGDAEDIENIVLRVLDSIESAAKTKGQVTGIPTGFYDLDYKMAGLQPSDLILIAARPSMGKTAFALNIAEYVTVRAQVPTAIFSLEMSKEQLVRRILAMNSKVDSQAMRTGDLADEDWTKLIDSARIIGNTNLFIDDTANIPIAELRSKCRKLKLEHNLGLVIIDYLQLMSTGRQRVESRQLEISEISRSLKALAREINAPVIALSQLSRAVEQREDKRPMLSDLRDSGAIEQDADVVMFLYRDEYYNKDSESAGQTEVIIAKQRNGPTGTIKLAWLAQYTKFANLEGGQYKRNT